MSFYYQVAYDDEYSLFGADAIDAIELFGFGFTELLVKADKNEAFGSSSLLPLMRVDYSP